MLNNLLFFIAGLLTTTIIVVILNWYSKRKEANAIAIKQSVNFEIMKHMFPGLLEEFYGRYTQALSYEDSKSLKYVQVSNKAYWIYKNKVYCTDVSQDGKFDPEKGKPTEMKNLSEDQIKQMLYIYNSLKNG